MWKLDLRVRNLETAETLTAPFESEVDACRWLMERPRWIEVLGVATHDLPLEVYNMLRTVTRPLDDDEKALSLRFDALEEAARAQAEEEARRLDREEHEAYVEAQRTGDPNRPMTVTWTLEDGVRNADPLDPRPCTAEAREAVVAWVRERDDWVKDRGMIVGEANLTVWPGALPAGEDRVHRGGQFIPVVKGA